MCFTTHFTGQLGHKLRRIKMQEYGVHCYYACIWMVNIEVTAIHFLVETSGSNITEG